jgi:hypothetical protein
MSPARRAARERAIGNNEPRESCEELHAEGRQVVASLTALLITQGVWRLPSRDLSRAQG